MFAHQEHNTPISPAELDQLIPNLSNQAELNEWEMQNIIEAEGWCFGRALKTEDPFSEDFIRKLHERMFRRTWRWAGIYRTTEKNLGVSPVKIREMLKALLDDANYWIRHQTFETDELALRFHHRLVSIHPFPNGNGRHSRLMADILVVRHGSRRFSWGKKDLTAVSESRLQYIKALKSADGGDLNPLLKFAR